MPEHTDLHKDEQHIELELVRQEVYRQIVGPDGQPSWSKADKLARAQIPAMCAATVIRFATGETKRPSSWTIKLMTRQADFRLVAQPRSWKVKKGSFEL